jgi:hypothetical protein
MTVSLGISTIYWCNNMPCLCCLQLIFGIFLCSLWIINVVIFNVKRTFLGQEKVIYSTETNVICIYKRSQFLTAWLLKKWLGWGILWSVYFTNHWSSKSVSQSIYLLVSSIWSRIDYNFNYKTVQSTYIHSYVHTHIHSISTFPIISTLMYNQKSDLYWGSFKPEKTFHITFWQNWVWDVFGF